MADRAEVKFVDGGIGFRRRLADIHETKEGTKRSNFGQRLSSSRSDGESFPQGRLLDSFLESVSNNSKHFRNRKRRKRISENRPWYSAGAQRVVTDMAEVKFVDLWVSVQRPHVDIQGKQKRN